MERVTLKHLGRTLFTHEELACPWTGRVVLDPAFEQALVDLRATFGRPMVVTSCCRSEGYNASLDNASPVSLHVWDQPNRGATGTCAIDVVRRDGAYARELAKVAFGQGWTVGVGRTFMHLDYRRALGEVPVLFGYGG